ncbi:MAG: ABC transporter ATP-binding protein [Actinomycetota bacterium]
MSQNILQCRDLKKVYGDRTVVDGVSFEIAAGESYGLLGPNGAGKTTTISMICGLLTRDGGDVNVDGKSMNTKSIEAKKAIGYVPQDIALYPDLTGLENLRFWGRMYGLSKKALATRVDEVLEVVGLTERGKERISTYSGGMKRRINIAAGLLHEPRLLILDEPTVGVDPQSRNAILENVESLRSQGIAVLYTSHYMEEVERLCDRVGIIDDGKLIAQGTRRELVETLGHTDRIELTVTGDLESFAHEAKRIPGVEEASVVEGGLHLLGHGGTKLLPKILEVAVQTGADVASIEVIEPDLEAVFLHLTGKALRD